MQVKAAKTSQLQSVERKPIRNSKSAQPKFTPGTWRQLAVTGRVLADLPTGETLVVHDGESDNPRHLADARLIAAAPSLYYSLKHLYKYARKLEGEGFTGSEIEQARKAIEIVECDPES